MLFTSRCLLIVFFFCFAVGGTAIAQSAFTDSSTAVLPNQGQAQSIPEQVEVLEKNLQHLQQLLDSGNNVSHTATLLEQLSVNEDNITEKIEALKQTGTQTDAPDAQAVTQADIDQSEEQQQVLAQTITANTQRLDALRAGLNALKKAQTTQRSLLQLLSNPVNQNTVSADVQAKIKAFAGNITQTQQQFGATIDVLMAQQADLEIAVAVLKRWKSALSATLVRQKNGQKTPSETLLSQTDEASVLKASIADLQAQLIHQRDKMDLQAIEKLQQAIYQKQSLLWLSGIDRQLSQLIDSQGLNIDINALESLPLPDMERQRDLLLAAQSGLTHLQETVTDRYLEFEKYSDIVGAQPSLNDAFTQRLKAIAFQQLLLKNQPQILSERITAKRQETLFQLDDLYTQQSFLQQLQDAPNTLLQMLYQVKISFQALWQAVLTKPLQTLLPTLIGVLAAITLLRKLRYRLRKVGRKQRSKTITLSDTISKTWYLFRKRYFYLYVFIMFVALLVYAGDVPYPANGIIWTLLGTLMTTLIWLTLIRVEVKQGMFSHQYARYSVIATLILAVFVVCYSVAFMSAVAPMVLSLYEKALMLTLALFIGIERKKLLIYFSRHQEAAQNKMYRLYLWLLNLLPLPWLIMATCFVSLVGYGRLAWVILAYTGVVIVYLTTVTLGIKVINSLRKKAKLYSIRRFQHGAFIAGDIVSPLSTVSKIVWLWAATVMLFASMGWGKDNYLIAKFLVVVQYPWATFGETVINLQMIALLVLAVYVIFRAARWLRTFSYHWLYARIRDLGVRSSLSIFSQYVAVMVGVLLALKFLGIDLTSLAVFAGALGVGVGLGLQDIAKNFISGILLLIERPLRNGDWISLDGNEGTVKSIGMRAITIETFDRQEVIIPNGNAIGNSLVNNTHSNTILRDVLYVGAGYDSPPDEVIGILEKILSDTDAILADPAPMVVLWEYADSSINYRVQYYLNIQANGMFSTRTAVLNRIWHEFKANAIEIPFPQRDVHLRQG